MAIRQKLNNSSYLALAHGLTLTHISERDSLNGRDINILKKIHSKFALNEATEFRKFYAIKMDWSFENVQDPIDLTAGLHGPEEERQATYQFVELFFKAFFEKVKDHGGLDTDIVHMYLNCTGVDFVFSLDYAGRDKMTLGGLLHSETGDMDKLIENFAALIQSGTHVILDASSSLRVWLFRPPVGGASRIKYANPEEYILKIRSVRRVITDEGLCLPAAIILAGMSPEQFKSSHFDHLASETRALTRLVHQARKLCDDAGVDSNLSSMGLEELNLFGEFLKINLHVLDFSSGNLNDLEDEKRYHSTPFLGKEHRYLILVAQHFHAVSPGKIQGVLRNMINNNRVICDDCQLIFSNQNYKNQHTCTQLYHLSTTQQRDKYVDYATGKSYYFYPNEGEISSIPQFIKPTKERSDKIAGIIFLDFETYPCPTPRTPPADADAMDNNFTPSDPMDVFVNDYGVLLLDPYVPLPYNGREMDYKHYSYKQTVNLAVCIKDSSEEVFTFYNLQDCMKWICQPHHQNYIVMAHCGGRFDFQMLYEEYLTSSFFRQGKQKDPIMKGQKIQGATLCYNIRLLDSYNFISKPLSALPAIFGFEGQKGDFPHLFNLPKHQNYYGSIPALEWFDPETKSPKKRAELIQWHKEQVEQKFVYDFQQEILKYCIMDVVILKKAMLAFRDKFLTLRDTDGKDISVDPFQYLTIASVAFDGIYRRYYLPEKTLMVVQRPGKQLYSRMQIAWLTHLMRTDERPHIQHALNGSRHGAGEVKLPGTNLLVDGYCVETNTAYEFYGCYWHGCPKCFEATKACDLRTQTYKDKKTGKFQTKPVLMGELYTHTMIKADRIKAADYNLIEIWECGWKAQCKKLSIDPRGDEVFTVLEPLIPRDAYFGGRVNCTKMLYHCTGTEKIFFMDVSSMYPTVQCQYPFPIGLPQILTRHSHEDTNFLPVTELFGLMKCKVQTPSTLYHGVLPVRDVETGKITFPLGEFIGTWTSAELQLAVEMGYQITAIYCQHHFPQSSTTLFKSYIDTFYAIKAQASTAGNKGLAEVAKLLINSPTGKWGFNMSKQHSTKLIKNTAQFYHYLLGEYTRASINIINQDVALVTVPDHDQFAEFKGANVYIAAFITAYARVKLYREALVPCGERVLYFDTDSVIYVSPTGDPIIPIDTTKTLGLWTSEARPNDYFTDFCSAGPKTYALKTFNGAVIEKSKGFSLHFNNLKIFNYDSLEQQVISRSRGEDVTALVLHKDETVMVRNLFQVLVKTNKGKVMKMPYDKRIIVSPRDLYPKFIDTLPHGHQLLPKVKARNLLIKAAFGLFEAVKHYQVAETDIRDYTFPDRVKQRILDYLII